MRVLTWSVAVVLLAGLTAGADEPSTKGNVEQVRKQEVERLRATETYFRKAGKISSAEFYRLKADQVEKKPTRVPTIYVPVIKSEGVPREQAIEMTELLGRALEQNGAYKMVGSPDEADFIFDGTLRPSTRPKK